MPALSQDALSRFRGSDGFKLLRLDGNFVRWDKPNDAGDLILTYRVLDEFQAFEGARNCRRMTGLKDLESRSHLAHAQFQKELQAAFKMWEQAADLRFREAEAGENPNIVIGAQSDPEGWAFADVFYNAAALQEIKPITRALVCLNPQKHWKVGFNGDLKVYDLRYTLAHEIGHAIGLDHPNGAGQIMGYRYEESFRELQEGDLSGVAAIYGAPRGHDVVVTSSIPPKPAGSAVGDEMTSRALNPK